MIKYAQRVEGKTFLILGLSAANLSRLRKGQPIIFNAADLGYPDLDIGIFTGETEEAMTEELRRQGLITKNTTEIYDFGREDHNNG